MKNLKVILIICLLFLPVLAFGQGLIINSKALDGNNIRAWFKNNGSFNRDSINNSSGFEWPIGTGKHLTYSSGLWLIGIVGQDTLAAISDHYGSEYLRGYIDINGIPHGKDDNDYRIYKIVKGDTVGIDFINWPVNEGAYLDSNNKPFLPGTQTLFYSMTDGYSDVHYYSAPMKAQVQVTSWCYNSVSDPVISNTIFSEFKIINKNSLPWNNAVISVWSDECSSEQIAIGCDTNLSLGYSYCTPNSFQYGNNPPAHGFLLLQGPAKYTGNINDTVYTFIPGNNNRRIKIGYKEVNLSSFNMFQNASGVYQEPGDIKEVYYTVQGLFFNGNAWVIPGTSTTTKFPYFGDPESGTGWNQFSTMGYGNRRLLMNFGFLNFNPGDTQTIVVAQIVSQGINNLNSVTKLKQNAVYIKNVFENNFTTVSVNEQGVTNLPDNFELFQNYPNPFNPATKIRFNILKSGNVALIVYDINGKEISTLFNGFLYAGEKEFTFDGSGFASGIYFYKVTEGKFSDSKKMILSK